MDTNPYVSPQYNQGYASPAPQSVPVFKAWAVFFVMSAVGSFVAGAIAGAVLGTVLAASGFPVEGIRLWGAMVGFLVSLPVSYLCFRFSVTTFLLPRS